jgi:hypothetical protein
MAYQHDVHDSPGDTKAGTSADNPVGSGVLQDSDCSGSGSFSSNFSSSSRCRHLVLYSNLSNYICFTNSS